MFNMNLEFQFASHEIALVDDLMLERIGILHRLGAVEAADRMSVLREKVNRALDEANKAGK